uniref:Clustered mitochondria protein homolog n=1 Tax=Sphaeramia orbicularis TaxID=375764 RepID=A0A672YDS7_9TELE
MFHFTVIKMPLFYVFFRVRLPPVEAMPTPYHTRSWLGPPCASRTHKNTFSRLGVDQQPAAQAPDWNEELQAAKDLPQGSLEERLRRDKALLQVNSAFVRAVTQGAETVIDGFVEPVNGNPEDPAFLWGGLFMSQGAASDVFGGERGRRAAQRLELQGVQAYGHIEGLQGLHTLPTAVVDYRGVRMSAQGLAPGLEGLLYGVNAGPQESPQRRRLLEHLASAAKALSLQRNVVVAPKGHKVPLFTSVDAQGLVGADGRFYLLDVFRSLPADANFCPEAEDYCSSSGLPTSFPHGLCRLRPELVQAFIQHKHNQFTQRVREQLDENGGFEECDSRSTNAVRDACKEVGSVSNIIFEMRFNPNVFSPGITFPDTESKSVKLQERLLREAAAFIITHQIPAFLEFCLQNSEVPMDGASLKQALHLKGINLRYLGHVIKAISQSEHKERLRHILRTAIGEIFLRSTKRTFNSFLQGVEVPSLSAAVSHFLCCLLVPHFTPTNVGEDTKKKSRRRGRGAGPSESTPWSTLTGSELWNLVCQDATETYNISDVLGSGPNHLVDHYGLQRLSLLRGFCLKTGVQLRLRDYVLDNQNKAPIGPDDILNIFPVVKHINIPIVDASKAYHAAQISVQKGVMDQAHEQLKEASYLFGRVCDDLHPDACHCYSLMARVAFLQGKAAEARSVQLKAVVISERVFGFDHPNTIQQYALLAVYMYAGGENALAQKCLLRARLLMLTVHGEDHPYTASLDSCLGLVVTGNQAEQYLKNALRLSTSFFGPTDLHTALNQHLLAQWMCSKGDYRGAMTHEKEALAAFTSMFGEDHPQTRCSVEFLSNITKQAVRVERSLRQAGAECSEQVVEVHSGADVQSVNQSVTTKQKEYKQKHMELKAAVKKELLEKLKNELSLSAILSGEEKTKDQETEGGKEMEDGENTETNESGEEQPAEEMPVESTEELSANDHEVDPAENKAHEETTEEEAADSEQSDTGSNAQIVVNGEAEMKSGSDDNDEINGATQMSTSPSVLKSNTTWADIVSKPLIVNGETDKDTAVTGAEDVTANGVAEE